MKFLVRLLRDPDAGIWLVFRDAAAPLKSLQGFFHCLLPRVPSLDSGLAEGCFYRYGELLQLEDKAGFSHTEETSGRTKKKLQIQIHRNKPE